MAVTAAVKFTQNAVVGTAGQAYKGTTGLAVTVDNGDNTDVVNWTITLISAPYDSALALGVVDSGSDGMPTTNFTPDVVGSYALKVEVDDGGSDVDSDVRVFSAPLVARDWIVPAFDGSAAAHNFNAQAR